MHLPAMQRKSKNEILAAYEKARRETWAEQGVSERMKTAADAYTRKNFDRNFIKLAEKILGDESRVSMADGWHGDYNIYAHLKDGVSVRFYGIKTIEDMRKTATDRMLSNITNIENIEQDVRNIDAILEQYDRAYDALIALDALQIAGHYVREEMPLTKV